MKRIGFLLKVKAELLPEYTQHHAAVWPEMLDALRRTGWRNYSIFARKDGLLFGYFEADESLQASQAGMAGEAVNAKWPEFMAPYFENLGGRPAPEGLADVCEVFHPASEGESRAANALRADPCSGT